MKWRRLLLAASGATLAVWLCLSFGAGHTSEDTCLRIGAIYITMNNPFYSVIDEELRLMIESRGDILLTRDPALDQDKQNAKIHALLDADIDLLVWTISKSSLRWKMRTRRVCRRIADADLLHALQEV